MTYKETEACDRSEGCCNSGARERKLAKMADHHIGGGLDHELGESNGDHGAGEVAELAPLLLHLRPPRPRSSCQSPPPLLLLHRQQRPLHRSSRAHRLRRGWIRSRTHARMYRHLYSSRLLTPSSDAILLFTSKNLFLLLHRRLFLRAITCILFPGGLGLGPWAWSKLLRPVRIWAKCLLVPTYAPYETEGPKPKIHRPI